MMEHVTHTFTGMNKDISKGKYPNTLYYDAKNIKLFSDKSQSTLAVSNQRGPKLIGSPLFTTIYNDNRGKRIVTDITALNPIHYTSDEVLELLDGRESISIPHQVIGYGIAQNGFVLFTTSDYGADGIWFLEYLTNKTTLLYLRRMNFSKERPIQAIVNYETESIEKVYWVDGENQLRFLNIRASVENGDSSNIIDIPYNNILSVSSYTSSAPDIVDIIEGGNHVASKVQYAYTLYRVNGSETKLSPLSELIPLGNALGGGDVNEVVSGMPMVRISNIDPSFTNIRIYRFRYTTFNAVPSIDLVEDSNIEGSSTINHVDSGGAIASVNINEITFAGNDMYIPKHIQSKDNRLFAANYINKDYRIDLDTRIYSFAKYNTCKVYDNIFINGNVISGQSRDIILHQYTDDPDDNFDSINISPNTQLYDPVSGKYGARGKYFALTIDSENKTNGDNSKGLKDDEIYRFAVRFYNKYGQKTEPKWMVDLKVPPNNFEDLSKINTVSVSLTDNFFNWLNTLDEETRPVGYDILFAERNIRDRTIVASGLLSTMIFQHIEHESSGLNGSPFIDEEPILPSTIMRNIDPSGGVTNSDTFPARNIKHLEPMTLGFNHNSEIQHARKRENHYASHWQYTKMMQLYSPELLFNSSPTLTESMKLRVKGAMRNTLTAAWLREYNIAEANVGNNAKTYGAVSPKYAGNTAGYTGKVVTLNGNANDLVDTGLFGHPSGPEWNSTSEMLFYRKYGIYHDTSEWDDRTNLPIYLNNEALNKEFTIYGRPEFSELGHSYRSYNNDFRYRYSNNLTSMMVDGDDGWNEQGPYDRKMLSYNVNGQRAITFMLNDSQFAESDISVETDDRLGFEDLYYSFENSQKFTTPQVNLYCEFVRSPNEWLFSGIYGGNSHENKLRTFYRQFSKFITIEQSNPSKTLHDCGDTYVQNFKFLRLVRGDVNYQNASVGQYEEVVEFPVETTVDLSNRDDSSLFDWDNNHVYLNNDYHKYNQVYSQQSNVFISRASEYTTRHVDEYNTSIIASKFKYPGELIDNWSDLLSNEVLSVDGKYGPIRSIVSHNDQIYSFQDSAISHISINPRVQLATTEGAPLELGVGSVLHDYRYLSTESGSINKWSILPTSGGIYYFDALNRNINIVRENTIYLSDNKGMKTHFENVNLSGNIDNPLVNQGVLFGYNQDKGIVNAVFNLPDYKEMLSINIPGDVFISRHTYAPNIYMTKGDVELVFDSNLRQPYQMYKGLYNNYFGKDEESSITLLVSDKSQLIKVMDNIKYKMEAYDDNNDQPFKTLSKIRVYNEYQDSGYVDVAEGRRGNARRRFRDWNVMLPRDGRDRIRNSWNFIELVFSSDIDKDTELILHDVTVSYTV